MQNKVQDQRLYGGGGLVGVRGTGLCVLGSGFTKRGGICEGSAWQGKWGARLTLRPGSCRGSWAKGGGFYLRDELLSGRFRRQPKGAPSGRVEDQGGQPREETSAKVSAEGCPTAGRSRTAGCFEAEIFAKGTLNAPQTPWNN